MADAEAAFSEVLKWVRDVTSDSPVLGSITGISDSELQQLARLAVLIRVRIADEAPAALIHALIPSAPIQPSADVLSAFNCLVTENAVDRLAELYAAIVKPANRRPLGTFFTPRDYALAIVDGYASRHADPTEVIDVGAGVGIFSEIAHTKWTDATINAVDINPVTLGLQSAATAGRPEWKVRLELADYRTWLESKTPTGSALYIGNPPYTRWQLLDQGSRAQLLEAAGGLVGARANLSTLFLAMTIMKLRPNDSLAMIIPAGWMRANYGKKLRAYLRAMTHRRIFLRLADSWRFDEAIVDAVLVEVGPEASSLQPIEVSDWSGSEHLTMDRTGDEAVLTAPGRTHLSVTSEDSREALLAQFARTTRGTASGAHTFFVRQADEWDALGIPAEFRQPLARRLRHGTGLVPSLETAELLVLGNYKRFADENVEAWINAAEAKGVHERHLCAKRSRWYDLSAELKRPDVIVSALARDTFRVITNPNRTLAITNNLFGLYWKSGVDEATGDQITDWLRSGSGQAALRASASVEANGLYRLSPTAMGQIALTGFNKGAGDADRGSAGLIESAGTPK